MTWGYLGEEVVDAGEAFDPHLGVEEGGRDVDVVGEGEPDVGEDQGGGIEADGDVAVGTGVEVGVVGEVVEVPKAEEPLGGVVEVDGFEAHVGCHVDEGLGVGAEADPGVVWGGEEGVLRVVGGGRKGRLVELELPVRDARGIEVGKVAHGCRVSDGHGGGLDLRRGGG